MDTTENTTGPSHISLPGTATNRPGNPVFSRSNTKHCIYGELANKDIHALYNEHTDIYGWGYSTKNGPRHANHRKTKYIAHLRYCHIDDLYSGKTEKLYYTGNPTGKTWITIDIDEHTLPIDAKSDKKTHLQYILNYLGINRAYQFDTDRGLHCILVFEGCTDNKSILKKLEDHIKPLTKKLFNSSFEMKGYSAERSLPPTIGVPDVFGILARYPKILLRSEVVLLSTINLSYAKVCNLVGDAANASPAIKKPVTLCNEFCNYKQTGKAGSKTGKHHSNATSSNAFDRMKHAGWTYFSAYKRVPSSCDELCDYYVTLGLNNSGSSHSPARIGRAKSVIAYLSELKPSDGVAAASFDASLHQSRVEAIQMVLSPEQIKELKGNGSKAKRIAVLYEELAAYEILTLVHGVCSRDQIMKIMNQWVEDGYLPSLINNHKMSAFAKVMVAGKFVVYTKHQRPDLDAGTRGRARVFRPGVNGVGFDEWRSEQVAAESNIAESTAAPAPAVSDGSSSQRLAAPSVFVALEAVEQPVDDPAFFEGVEVPLRRRVEWDDILYWNNGDCYGG